MESQRVQFGILKRKFIPFYTPINNMNLWLTDPVTGQKSVTLTFFIVGFIVCLSKMIFSGVTIGTFSLSLFSGIDFAAAVGALGGVYVLRRNQNSPEEPPK